MKSNPIAQMWRSADAFTGIAKDEIHVWRVKIDPADHVHKDARELLSQDELARMDCFLFHHVKHRFATTRLALRRILGRCLNIAPEKLLFHYGPQGKPRLPIENNPDNFQFNVTHTQGLALIAVSRKRDIGIDVEWIRTTTDYTGVAQHIFTTREWQILHELPEAERLAAFYSAWTRKEALVKAIGQGFSYSFERLEVLCDTAICNSSFTIDRQSVDADSYWLSRLEPATDYLAALAAKGPPCTIRFWDYA